jgi:pepF/M3 family oligoendopeptidase
MTPNTVTDIPHWDLSNVYPDLNSPEFKADSERMVVLIDELAGALEEAARHVEHVEAESAAAVLAKTAGDLVTRFNDLLRLALTLRAYLSGFTSVDSYNLEARRVESQFQVQSARLDELTTRFRRWVGQVAPHLPEMISLDATTREHAFALQEAAERSRYQMSPVEESLAAELSLSGSRAWTKLQSNVTSQLTVDFELDGKVQTLAMPALINLRSHTDESVRRRGYEAELAAWPKVQESLAAAMNGIKGETITLNKRRGWPDALHAALVIARIDQQTLEAMLGAMVDSFPAFRRYFRAKARRLGKEKLAWWDLFAPVGAANRVYTWDETRRLILDNFSAFSPHLSALAQRAFDHHWIDAEPRPGKQGGAFCMGVPAVKESRILSNFDGSLDQLSTVAHELGHAFHNDCIYAAGKTLLQSRTPMTLAETASIMNETIITQAALAQVSGPEEELGILETALMGDSQVIVDIYSRFIFEREVFARRAKAELSAAELCELMAWAQKESYGDGLDERYLQPYMWTWKPHYYSADLPYYNFPYAFGLLFGLGLYAIYQQRGETFVSEYQSLLASTGEDTAANLAARFNIDIRQKDFWAASLKIIEGRIDRYEKIE